MSPNVHQLKVDILDMAGRTGGDAQIFIFDERGTLIPQNRWTLDEKRCMVKIDQLYSSCVIYALIVCS
jgi:hypothetical protein